MKPLKIVIVPRMALSPYPAEYADASLVSLEDFMLITIHSPKGEELFRTISRNYPVKEVLKEELQAIDSEKGKDKRGSE